MASLSATSTSLKYLQEQELQHFPGQPSLLLNHPLSEEILSDIHRITEL